MPSTVALTPDDLLAAVAAVEDPEIGRTLADLGMLKAARFDRGDATLEVQLLTPAYPHRAEIETRLRTALETLPGVDRRPDSLLA